MSLLSVASSLKTATDKHDKFISAAQSIFERQLNLAVEEKQPGKKIEVWVPNQVTLNEESVVFNQGIGAKLIALYQAGGWDISFSRQMEALHYFSLEVPPRTIPS